MRSFSTLGGDSLSYLAMALDLEALLGDLPEDWIGLSIAELEGITRKTGAIGWMDTPTVLRAFAISMIVGQHFSVFNLGGGGVSVLLFIAGMTFGALTLPAVLQAGSVLPVSALLIRILLLSWVAITVNWVIGGYGGPLAYLMIANWIDPFYPGAFWFIAIYMQLLLVLTMLLLLVLRYADLIAWLTRDPFPPLAILAGLSVLLVMTKTPYAEEGLLTRLPHLMGWLFICGALTQAADTLARKAVTLVFFLAGWMLMSGVILIPLFLIPLLIFLPRIPVPRILALPVRQIASASLMIYLTHFQFRNLLGKVIEAGPLGNMVFAIAGGVVAWIAYQPFDDWLRRLVARKPGSALA